MGPEREFSRDVKRLMHLAKKRGWNPHYFKLMCEAVVNHLDDVFTKIKAEKDQLDAAVSQLQTEVATHIEDQMSVVDETPAEVATNDNL